MPIYKVGMLSTHCPVQVEYVLYYVMAHFIMLLVLILVVSTYTSALSFDKSL